MDTYRNITKDAFLPGRVTPSGAIAQDVLLFDNYGAINPLQSFFNATSIGLFQMTVFFLMQGEAQFRINGEDVMMNGGQALTTLPDTEMLFLSASPDHKYLLFVIYPELLRKTYNDIYLNYDKTTFGKGYMIASCSEEEMSLYQILYIELKKECLRPEYEYKMIAVRSYLNALLINNLNLYNIADSIDVDPHSRQYDVYQKFLNELNKHAKTERTVKFYADQLHISPKYLSFVSLQYSNKNASQWISEYVVHNARILMGTHHMSASETSNMLNFPTLNSFNRFFKRVTGQSPKDFIRSLKQQQ